MSSIETAALEVLRKTYGYDSFRGHQAEVIGHVASGGSAFVLMPTGAGKSLCYQLPALMREDEVTVVVSPLVSLMNDQVAGLERAAAGRAVLINSQRDAGENREALARVRGGGVRLLYVAPERFAAPGFVEALEGVPVGMFVVDEAHCVSQWGHDFRPDYFELPRAARALGARQIFAATATATPRVAGDVIVRLGLRDAVRVTTGFDRPNLSYIVIRASNDEDRRQRITAVLSDPAARPAIVYAGTRARTQELAGALAGSLGVGVAAYHAGLEREARDRAQRAFMSDEVEIVVATNAFGMGIDKPDVRTVCHAAVPESLEAYYQEAGRAGRDGAPARCLLFAAGRDKGLHVHFINQSAAGEARTARWAQYRGIWAFAEGEDCRRVAIQRHFGDRSTPHVGEGVACCDVCDPTAVPAAPARSQRGASATRPSRTAAGAARSRPAHGATASGAEPGVELDRAIVELVATARPSVGRTRAVEVLRGGRSKVVVQNGYDSLELYGAFAHLSNAETLARVDQLIERGLLRSTGGRFPKLALSRQARDAGRLAA